MAKSQNEGKTPEGKKPEGNKPEGNKPEGITTKSKKPAPKKPEEKKSEGITTEAKKPEDKKAEANKPEAKKKSSSGQRLGVWGIDLGQCALKAVRVEDVDGTLTATNFDYVEHPKILSQPDADPDQLTREALEKFLSRNSLRGDQVAISIPGQAGLARFVKLPPVEEKKITDIVRFEAKQQIPFNLDEVVWDYQKLGSGMVTDGYAMETEIGLFAMKRDMVNRALEHFKEVNVDVHLVQMAPLSLCNFLAYDCLGKNPNDEPDSGAKTCVVGLDIGADSSNLVITDGGRIIWQRPIPIGGNHFTRALTKDLKLTFAKAEHLKRNATKSPELKRILASIKPVLNDFFGEVQRSLGFFTNTHRNAEIEYMVALGNAFRLPGLQKFLSEKLQLDVRKLSELSRLQGPVVSEGSFKENIMTFGVAYGLAIQGLSQSRLTTNLLPQEMRVERLIRAKKPWAAAAAAVLFLGTAAMAFNYYAKERTYGHPAVVKAIKASEGVKSRADSAQQAFTKAKTDAENEEKSVKALVAGQFERTNWINLFQFLSKCLPKPDGSNLKGSPEEPKPAKDWNGEVLALGETPWYRYWEERAADRGEDAMTGKEAYKLFSSTKGTETDPTDPLGKGIDDLIQVNIEAVRCRYCGDLGKYWNAATLETRRVPAHVRPHVKPKRDAVDRTPKWPKPPEGKGWVVELRGYTFHHGKENFVLETLIENIARFGYVEKVETKPGAPGAPAQPGATPPAGKPGQPGTPTNPMGTGTGTPRTPMTGKGGTPTTPPSGKAEAPKEPMDKGAGKQPMPAPGTKPDTKPGMGSGGKPPAGKPMDPGTGAPAAQQPGASGANPTKEDPIKEPVVGNVSHVLLYFSHTQKTHDTKNLSALNAVTGLDALIGGGLPGSSGVGGGATPLATGTAMPSGASTPGADGGAMGGTAATWEPLMNIAGASTAGSRGDAMSGATLPGATGGKVPFRPGGVGGTPMGVGEEGTRASTTAKHERTEFIILFIWKEPTPSDELRGMTTGGTSGGFTPPSPGGFGPR